MNTRFAPTPVSSGFSVTALRDIALKVAAYVVLLGETFAEAKAQARAAQARRTFIEE